MPKGSEMYAPWSQQLLRAARAGRIHKTASADDAKDDPNKDNESGENGNGAEEASGTTQKGFVALRWTQVPRHLEGPEREFLAKRRKGLPSAHAQPGWVGGVLTLNGTAMRKTKVKKADASGQMVVWDVLMPEGQTVEGEIGEMITLESAAAPVVAPAPGTVVEGLGVANDDGVIMANEAALIPIRRRAPPPRRKAKKGPSRGRKKAAAASGVSTSVTAFPVSRENGGDVPGGGSSTDDQLRDTLMSGMNEGEVEGDGEEEDDEDDEEGEGDEDGDGEGEGEDDGDEGEEGEDGDEGEEGEDGEDDDREEGELSEDDLSAPAMLSSFQNGTPSTANSGTKPTSSTPVAAPPAVNPLGSPVLARQQNLPAKPIAPILPVPSLPKKPSVVVEPHIPHFEDDVEMQDQHAGDSNQPATGSHPPLDDVVEKRSASITTSSSGLPENFAAGQKRKSEVMQTGSEDMNKVARDDATGHASSMTGPHSAVFSSVTSATESHSGDSSSAHSHSLETGPAVTGTADDASASVASLRNHFSAVESRERQSSSTHGPGMSSAAGSKDQETSKSARPVASEPQADSSMAPANESGSEEAKPHIEARVQSTANLNEPQQTHAAPSQSSAGASASSTTDSSAAVSHPTSEPDNGSNQAAPTAQQSSTTASPGEVRTDTAADESKSSHKDEITLPPQTDTGPNANQPSATQETLDETPDTVHVGPFVAIGAGSTEMVASHDEAPQQSTAEVTKELAPAVLEHSPPPAMPSMKEVHEIIARSKPSEDGRGAQVSGEMQTDDGIPRGGPLPLAVASPPQVPPPGQGPPMAETSGHSSASSNVSETEEPDDGESSHPDRAGGGGE